MLNKKTGFLMTRLNYKHNIFFILKTRSSAVDGPSRDKEVPDSITYQNLENATISSSLLTKLTRYDPVAVLCD